MAPLKIEISGLGYAVGGVEILKGVDARVPDGEITAVVGPSGAGKSTLLRAINRLIEPSSGEIYLDGEPTSGLDPLQLRRRVGMVFQIPLCSETRSRKRFSTGRVSPAGTRTLDGCSGW